MTDIEELEQEISELNNELQLWKGMAISQKQHWLYTFAGQAMQGIIAHYGIDPIPEAITEKAIERARHLLAELEKEQG